MAQTSNILPIPANVDALTSAWLTAALRESVPVTNVHRAPLAKQQGFFGALMRSTRDYAK